MRTHILFGASAGGTLKQAFKQNKINERVVIMPEDLMWGPLGNVLLDDVQASRLSWWERIVNAEDQSCFIPFLREAFYDFSEWTYRLNDDEQLLFWVGDSATEYTGFLCLLACLPKSNPTSVIMASTAYYKRYGKFRPYSAGEITPEKMLPIMDDAKAISPRVKEGYVTNWNRLIEEDGTLRIRKNRQVETVSEDYFDDDIIQRAKKISQEKIYSKSDGFSPSARLVGEVIGYQKQKVQDVYIEWRIRCLIQRGFLASEGSLASMRLYKIKPNLDGDHDD